MVNTPRAGSANPARAGDPAIARPARTYRGRPGDLAVSTRSGHPSVVVLSERKTGDDATPLPGWWVVNLPRPAGTATGRVVDVRTGLADVMINRGEWRVIPLDVVAALGQLSPADATYAADYLLDAADGVMPVVELLHTLAAER